MSTTADDYREVRSRCGAAGGAAVPAEKRSFSRNRELARLAGARGGAAVPAEARTFYRNPEKAREAGRIGGLHAQENARRRKQNGAGSAPTPLADTSALPDA